MKFSVGDHLVYPMHGAGTIVEIIERISGSATKIFYNLEFPYGHVKLMLPVESVEKVGVRVPMSGNDVADFFEFFKKLECVESNLPWNKRQNENTAKLLTNDIKKVAEVYKYLSLKGKDKPLSSGEQKMYTSAEHIIFSEIHFAGNISFEEIEKIFREILN